MATVYQYDVDGFLVWGEEDYDGPLPHGCDLAAPPETLPDGSPLPEYRKYRRTGPAEFELVEDYRGRTGWLDGAPHEITAWGPLPAGWSDTPPPPTPEEIYAAKLAAFTNAIQVHLDTFARTRNYDGILSATTYATSAVPKFRAEGQYAVEARDATWARAYEILALAEAGEIAEPSLEDLPGLLPALEWPDEAAVI